MDIAPGKFTYEERWFFENEKDGRRFMAIRDEAPEMLAALQVCFTEVDLGMNSKAYEAVRGIIMKFGVK